MTLTLPEKSPLAARIESTCTAHGQQWVDNYAWLRPDNWQEVLKDPSSLPAPIADYLKAENDYYDEATAGLAPLHKELAEELRGRMPEQVESIPEVDGPYKYQNRIVENAEYAILVRTDLQGNSEEVIFDVNAVASDFDYFDLGQLSQSPDHSKLLWSSDTKGAEFYTLYIREIASGLDTGCVIDNVDDATWADDQTIFYSRQNDAGRAHQIYRHVLGSNPDDDALVFSEADVSFSCAAYRSFSRDFIFIHTASFDQDEWWYIPIDDLTAPPVLIQARLAELEYYVNDQRDRFVILTNADDSIEWKMVETPIMHPSKAYWTDLVAHRSGHMIADFIVYRDWIVWLEVVNALGQIAYMDKNGHVERMTFDEEAYSIGIEDHYGHSTPLLMFQYSSPTTPWQTYEFDLQTGERVLLKKQIIKSGHNPKDYITRRFTVASHDGAQVPVTLLYRHDTPINGTAPALLYGYGCYGESSTAGFESMQLSLVDRGFIYAIAHVRGGSEKGGAWHEGAKLERKVNSFHDFNAVADALITQGYCAPNKVVSLGASAGGLLVTASMVMKPELFAGVIAEVPDVDVLNIMLDGSLPGIPPHWTEWGNPIESKTVFDAIQSYSPYENTTAMDYPALYITAGVSDPRVFFWQSAKWVAKIRSVKSDNNLVLLKTNMQSGHFGMTGRFAHIDDYAHMYAFAISVTMDEPN